MYPDYPYGYSSTFFNHWKQYFAGASALDHTSCHLGQDCSSKDKPKLIDHLVAQDGRISEASSSPDMPDATGNRLRFKMSQSEAAERMLLEQGRGQASNSTQQSGEGDCENAKVDVKKFDLTDFEITECVEYYETQE